MSESLGRQSKRNSDNRLSYMHEEKPTSLRYERKRLIAENYGASTATKDVYPTPDYDDLRSLYRQILT